MQYKIIRSKRKTAALSVDRQLNVIVRAPNKASKQFIDSFVNSNMSWIEKQIAKHKENSANAIRLSNEEITLLISTAYEVLSQKTKYFSSIMGLVPKGVKITKAKTRWGSCSYQNSICYSYRVMLLSEKEQDYIVVHELAHIKHKNHSKNFYKEIEKVLPNYKENIKNIKLFSNNDLYFSS